MRDYKEAVRIAKRHHSRLVMWLKAGREQGCTPALCAVVDAERRTRDYYMKRARDIRYFGS